MQVGEERNTVTYQCRNREAEKNERSRGTGGVVPAVGDGKVLTQGHSGEAEKQAAKTEIRVQGGNQKNTRKSKQPAKQMIGARKVWGTRKGVTCDEVAKAMVRIAGKLPTGFSVMKRMASVNGKKKWWFIVKAPERSLQCVDKAWNHKVCAEVRADLTYVPSVIHHLTLTQTHVCNLMPPSHYVLPHCLFCIVLHGTVS